MYLLGGGDTIGPITVSEGVEVGETSSHVRRVGVRLGSR